jgi:nucleotide-binding universal stress UspA family protein
MAAGQGRICQQRKCTEWTNEQAIRVLRCAIYGCDGLLCSLGERLDAWCCYRAPHRSKFYVAHVIPTDVYKSVPTEVMEEALKQTRAYVQHAMANQLRLEFLQAEQNEPVIKEGQVAPELLKLVAERNIGLLVIGTRGHHGLDRLLQVSIAEEVFRQAPYPVLIVPPTGSEQSGIPVRTILYPQVSQKTPFALFRMRSPGTETSCAVDTPARVG